ncbi:zonadhesin-like isoform X2 [Hyperolius riggenbachi]|uniref:zonadhesin-like isoform X2 n=1 Tax=Hyperolius riggenbachi TaxID=752182 RepID=UPI0035A2F7FD
MKAILIVIVALISLCCAGPDRLWPRDYEPDRERARPYGTGEEECTEYEHQVWDNCTAPCAPYCEDHEIKRNPCPRMCQGGCVCKYPYIFKKGLSGPCIPRNECIQRGSIKGSSAGQDDSEGTSQEDRETQGSHTGPGRDKCTQYEHQEWSECRAHCAYYCENHAIKRNRCTKICQGGCVCKYPYIFKNGLSGPCIPRNVCIQRGPYDTASAGQDDSEGTSQEDRETQGSHTGPGGPHSCSESDHKVWSDCNAHCADNCKNYQNPHRPCPLMCKPGCVCKYPYVFEKGTSGRCVHRDRCSSAGQDSEGTSQEDRETQGSHGGSGGPHSCSESDHKVWSNCNAHCADNCKNYENPHRPCPLMCKPGCVCKYPYVFEKGTSGRCVHRDRCSSAGQGPDSCSESEHKVWSPCNAHCADNCMNFRDQHRPCATICAPGCVCKPPYVFMDGTSDRCIHSIQCPVNSSSPGEGGQHSCTDPHKQWENCGLSCKKTCKNYNKPNTKCPYSCFSGCTCQYPYVFKEESSDLCVHQDQCPKFRPFNILSAGREECGAHQEFQSCGTACPDNCENYGAGDRPCILPCVQGCFCQKSYIFQSGESGACILPEECPSRYTEYAPRS